MRLQTKDLIERHTIILTVSTCMLKVSLLLQAMKQYLHFQTQHTDMERTWAYRDWRQFWQRCKLHEGFILWVTCGEVLGNRFYSSWNSHVGNECCVGVCCPQQKLELASNFSFRTFFMYFPYKEYATKYLNWTCTVCTNKPKPFWVDVSHLKSSIKELLDPNQLKDTWCKYWEICT